MGCVVKRRDLDRRVIWDGYLVLLCTQIPALKSPCVGVCLISLKLNGERFLHSEPPCVWCDSELNMVFAFEGEFINVCRVCPLCVCVCVLSLGWA